MGQDYRYKSTVGTGLKLGSFVKEVTHNFYIYIFCILYYTVYLYTCKLIKLLSD